MNNRTVQVLLDDEEDTHPSSLVYRNLQYELKWQGNTLVRITVHSPDAPSRDIAFAELPEVLRRLI